jgi:hypothetical protein
MATEGRSDPEEDRVEEMMRKMNLTEKEKKSVVFEELEEDEEDPKWDLVGKVLHRRVFHINTIRDALRPAWGNPRGLNFRSVGDNVFVATLETQRDRDRICEGAPWMVSKHAVVLEFFNINLKPDELRFERIPMWVRVVNLTFKYLRPPWVERIAALTGDVIKIDRDANGYAWGEFLRVRVWVPVQEPLMRCIKIDNIRKVDGERKKFVEFYDLQYENLPYFCFSCGLLGHADIFCPTPASRDSQGRLPYSDKLRAPMRNKSWGSSSSQNRGPSQSDSHQEDFEPGKKVVSPEKNSGRVEHMVCQFDSGYGRGRGSGNGGGRGRGRNQVYRKIQTENTTLMLLDQDTLNKKRLSEQVAESEESNDGSRDSKKKKKAIGEVSNSILAEAVEQPRGSQ